MEQTPAYCPQCGAALAAGASACERCGLVLAAQDAAPPAAPPAQASYAPTGADTFAPEWAPAARPEEEPSLPSDGAAIPGPTLFPRETSPAKTQLRYAGFWRRAIALVLDTFVISSVYTLLLHMDLVPELPAEISFTELSPAHKVILVMMLIYYVAMEASPVQATLGKRALELAVTNIEGGRISVLRALGRNAGKFLSQVILLLGFVMAGFTPRKQALHDLLAGCVVIRRQ